MDNFISEIDSQRFGFKIAKVNIYDYEPNMIIEKLNNSGVRLIISRVELSNLKLINNLENLGFETKDIQVTYRYDLLKPLKKLYNNSSFVIRSSKVNDIEELVNIAATSFEHYGHYSMDNLLDNSKCVEIYKDWVKRSCEDKSVADIVFVAEFEKKIVGFLSFLEFY
jgi:hypothetical protein